MIHDLKQDLKIQQSNLDKDLKTLQDNLSGYKDALATKQKELNDAKHEEMEKKKEKTKLLEKIKIEEEELKKKLEMAQKKLKSHHGEKNRITEDLKDKEKQLQKGKIKFTDLCSLIGNFPQQWKFSSDFTWNQFWLISESEKQSF